MDSPFFLKDCPLVGLISFNSFTFARFHNAVFLPSPPFLSPPFLSPPVFWFFSSLPHSVFQPPPVDVKALVSKRSDLLDVSPPPPLAGDSIAETAGLKFFFFS